MESYLKLLLESNNVHLKTVISLEELGQDVTEAKRLILEQRQRLLETAKEHGIDLGCKLTLIKAS